MDSSKNAWRRCFHIFVLVIVALVAFIWKPEAVGITQLFCSQPSNILVGNMAV